MRSLRRVEKMPESHGQRWRNVVHEKSGISRIWTILTPKPASSPGFGGPRPKSRFRRILNVLSWINAFSRENLFQNLLAAVTESVSLENLDSRSERGGKFGFPGGAHKAREAEARRARKDKEYREYKFYRVISQADGFSFVRRGAFKDDRCESSGARRFTSLTPERRETISCQVCFFH